MSRDDLHFRLRIPEEIKDWLRDRAKENMRSMTAEVLFILKEKMENEKAGSPPTA